MFILLQTSVKMAVLFHKQAKVPFVLDLAVAIAVDLLRKFGSGKVRTFNPQNRVRSEIRILKKTGLSSITTLSYEKQNGKSFLISKYKKNYIFRYEKFHLQIFLLLYIVFYFLTIIIYRIFAIISRI